MTYIYYIANAIIINAITIFCYIYKEEVGEVKFSTDLFWPFSAV